MLRHGKMSNGAEKLSKVSFILMTPPVRDPHPLRSRLDFSSSTTFSSRLLSHATQLSSPVVLPVESRVRGFVFFSRPTQLH